jgi:hypothetical protein
MTSPALPTEFRGCFWDDGWEFDAPCAVYLPWRCRRYGYGGNSGELDRLVENICWDLGNGEKLTDRGLAQEAAWRGWSLRGLRRRKQAWHVVFKVRWETEADGSKWGEIVDRAETFGPPKEKP